MLKRFGDCVSVFVYNWIIAAWVTEYMESYYPHNKPPDCGEQHRHGCFYSIMRRHARHARCVCVWCWRSCKHFLLYSVWVCVCATRQRWTRSPLNAHWTLSLATECATPWTRNHNNGIVIREQVEVVHVAVLGISIARLCYNAVGCSDLVEFGWHDDVKVDVVGRDNDFMRTTYQRR